PTTAEPRGRPCARVCRSRTRTTSSTATPSTFAATGSASAARRATCTSRRIAARAGSAWAPTSRPFTPFGLRDGARQLHPSPLALFPEPRGRRGSGSDGARGDRRSRAPSQRLRVVHRGRNGKAPPPREHLRGRRAYPRPADALGRVGAGFEGVHPAGAFG